MCFSVGQSVVLVLRGSGALCLGAATLKSLVQNMISSTLLHLFNFDVFSSVFRGWAKSNPCVAGWRCAGSEGCSVTIIGPQSDQPLFTCSFVSVFVGTKQNNVIQS